MERPEPPAEPGDPLLDPSFPEPIPADPWPIVPAPKRGRSAARAVAAGAIAFVVLLALGLVLDLDRDGDPAFAELRAGTSPWLGDSDGDGLEDGWERGAGLDALASDSDGDGVADDAEFRAGADPRAADSDGDGLGDHAEELLPDCDGDGARAVAEGDGDDDGRLDALEAAGDRCDADPDGDGVLDGSEGSPRCVHSVDCDGDGLRDGEERAGFDPLDPDSFGSGVADSVSFAFQESGQPPGADADDDGIPDGWEGDDGLIVWGDLRPQAGRRDLLVEYLRVNGPDSGRQAGLSFAPAYDAVASAVLAERGLHLRWVETVVPIAAETDPQLIPQLEDPYYELVLAGGRYSGNPYVTTVVLNPQHDQSQILHSGVAPIRGMLAAVDYGSHVVFDFAGEGQSITMYPVVESMVRGGRQDLLAGYGFQGGYTQAGDMGLQTLDGELTIIWQPSWFATAPRLVSDGPVVQLQRTGVRVLQGSLSGTILHELGHTLGLCHAHDSDCNAKFSARDRAGQAESTMSYDAPSNRLHFLDSEWTTVLQYISCPPDAPVTLVAEGSNASAVLDAKYGYANKNVTSVDLRSCNDLTAVPRSFQPGIPAATRYVAPTELRDPAYGSAGPLFTVGYAVLALGLVATAAVLAGRPRRS